MASGLTSKAKRLLAAQDEALMLNDNALTTKVETVRHIIKWCEHEDIKPGKWLVASKKYRFTRDGISKIRDAYLISMQEDIFDDFSEDNHQTASDKSADEKQGKIKPTHHLILAALTKNLTFKCFQQELYPCPQVNIELNINRVDFAIYDALIMIENRDSFNDWHLFQKQMTVDLGNVLVIYRGDSFYAVAAANLLKHWRDRLPDNPVVYFGDFDLSGLRIATSSQCTALLLPKYDWLKQHLISLHYPDNQLRFLDGMQRDCPIDWQPLLTLMSRNKAGLRQQKMVQTPLVVFALDKRKGE
jgi:hypothetical protein